MKDRILLRRSNSVQYDFGSSSEVTSRRGRNAKTPRPVALISCDRPIESQRSEGEFCRCLQNAAAANAVHVAPAAANCARDTAETAARQRPTTARIAELRRIAQLEGIDAKFQRRLAIDGKAFEE